VNPEASNRGAGSMIVTAPIQPRVNDGRQCRRTLPERSTKRARC
jgi:hypothetical protein